jgi:hypothetical protein
MRPEVPPFGFETGPATCGKIRGERYPDKNNLEKGKNIK